MKKLVALVLALLILSVPLITLAEGKTKIVIGGSPTPHVEILEFIKPMLAEKGYELDIQVFTDYVTMNPATTAGDLDANYFQHVPFLSQYNATQPDDQQLVAAIGVHYEPFALYAGKTKSLDELADGATITITNDPANEARAMMLLESAGLVTLREGAGLSATILDIVDNPKGLNITEIDAPQLPRTLADVDFAVINGNYALDAGLSPAKDAVFVEPADSEAGLTYTNYVVVCPEDQDADWVAAIREVITSDAVREFILGKEEYKGGVIPSF